MFKEKILFVLAVTKNSLISILTNVKLELLLIVLNFILLKTIVLNVKTDTFCKIIYVSHTLLILILCANYGIKEIRMFVIHVNLRQLSLRN